MSLQVHLYSFSLGVQTHGGGLRPLLAQGVDLWALAEAVLNHTHILHHIYSL